VGDRGQDVPLPAQDHRPQVIGAGDERVAGQGVEDEPRAGRHFILQLAR